MTGKRNGIVGKVVRILMGLFYAMAVEGRLGGVLGTFQEVVEAVAVAPAAMEVVPYVDFPFRRKR